MPNLPTISINDQSKYDRVVAAFPGSTQAEKVAAYRAWHNRELIDYVVRTEVREILDQRDNEAQAKHQEVHEDLDTM